MRRKSSFTMKQIRTFSPDAFLLHIKLASPLQGFHIKGGDSHPRGNPPAHKKAMLPAFIEALPEGILGISHHRLDLHIHGN